MPDVLLVFAQADAERAYELADVLEEIGYSIAGAPRGREELHVAGAALVLWSEAAAKSLLFLMTAQNAARAGKAVFVNIAETPPAIIRAARSYDLSRWSGALEDPLLDPLLKAIERRVRSDDFVSLYLRRLRAEEGCLVAADAVNLADTATAALAAEPPPVLSAPAPAVLPAPPLPLVTATPALQQSAPAPRREPPPRRPSQPRPRPARSTGQKWAVGAVAGVAALCALVLAGGGETGNQMGTALAEAPPAQLVVYAPQVAASSTETQPISPALPAPAGPAQAGEPAAYQSVAAARRAYRAQCSRYESADFCTCVSAGLAQEVAPADLRLALGGVGERLTAQGDAAEAVGAVEAAEQRYANACAQFRR